MAAAGPELCPHCQRPFKRLRAHLPHCKAAPPPATPPGPPRPAPSAAPAAAAARGAGRSGSRAVRDVARSLDLHPEEVEDVPGKLRKGVKVVIEKHRARVLRDKEPRRGVAPAGSGGDGPEPGPAPHPQRRKNAQNPRSKEPRSQGAAGSGAGSSEGEKSSVKATKALGEPPESRNSRGDLAQQEGRDKAAAGQQQAQEAGVGSEPPASALRAKSLQLSPAVGGHGRGTSKNELRRPRAGREEVQGVPEPVLTPGRAPGLALLPSARIQPAPSARAAGLEWFPALYCDYEGLRIFPGKRFHEDVRIPAETPKCGLAQGQQDKEGEFSSHLYLVVQEVTRPLGPLSQRPLMEVRLGELHTWISTCTFSPQGLLAAVHRAWGSYCAKYIHVRQGGPAGISMLLAGYCLLSYGWNYQHFKRHRWRKYH